MYKMIDYNDYLPRFNPKDTTDYAAVMKELVDMVRNAGLVMDLVKPRNITMPRVPTVPSTPKQRFFDRALQGLCDIPFDAPMNPATQVNKSFRVIKGVKVVPIYIDATTGEIDKHEIKITDVEWKIDRTAAYIWTLTIGSGPIRQLEAMKPVFVKFAKFIPEPIDQVLVGFVVDGLHIKIG